MAFDLMQFDQLLPTKMAFCVMTKKSKTVSSAVTLVNKLKMKNTAPKDFTLGHFKRNWELAISVMEKD